MKKSHFIPVIVLMVNILLPGITVSAQTTEPTPSPDSTPTPVPTCLPIAFEISGYVRDIVTTNPVNGARVNVSSTIDSIGVYTDENGYFEVGVAGCSYPEPLTFDITADGYEELIISTDSLDSYFEFDLVPPSGPTPSPSPGPVVTCQLLAFHSSGYVTDITSTEPIGGATITVDATIGTTSKQTDATGYYDISVMSCMLGDPATFTITAPGYETLVSVLGIGQVNNYDFELTANDCVLGDVNNDGFIDIIDALLVAQYYVGLIDLPYICAADVNCNGENDIIDALLIAQFYVGLITSFC